MAKFARLPVYERISVRDRSMIEKTRFCISVEKLPVVFRVTLFESFFGESTEGDGVIEIPREEEEQQGGHAMVIYGYDHTKRVFYGINSWGTEWGDEGHFTMPYAYFTAFCHDIWTVGFQSY